MVPTLDPVDDLFIGTPTWEVPPIEDRFAYKKKSYRTATTPRTRSKPDSRRLRVDT
jgi:hypothetical protein